MTIYRKIFLLILILSFLLGCQSQMPLKKDINKTNQIPTKKIDPIKQQISELTLDEKIGQMILVGFDGTTLNEHIKEMLTSYHVGGIILFQRNIQDSKQSQSLINSLKESNVHNKIPLFISIDEEGGRVTRMPKEIKNLPTNKKIGQVNNLDFSYKIGDILGLELKSFGFNMDFAPVLDINSNPKNPVIGNRSFGSDEKIVSTLGIQTMKGIQSQNIISVIKHFPGHGDTAVDSHLGLPVVNHTLERIKSFELVPFIKAIENDADAVMVAHILFPKIDPNYPASFSKILVGDLLRNTLKFDGVVMTDDMEMGAISKNYELEKAALESIKAGSDILLICHTYEKQKAVLNRLKTAVENHEISEERIDESVYRILKLKKKVHLSDEPVKAINIKEINDRIQNTLSSY